MKKISGIVIAILLAITLVACSKGNFTAKVVIDDIDRGNVDISFDLKLEDNDSLVSSTIYIRLTDNSGAVIKDITRTAAQLKEKEHVSFTGLIKDTKYTLVVTTTWKEKSYQLLKQEIATREMQNISIKTADDFFNIKNDLYATYVLENDIDFEGQESKIRTNIIGNFRGIFNGNGKAIKNYVLATTNSNAGIFSQIGNDAQIYDLVIDGFKMIDVKNDDGKVNKVGTSKYAGILFGQNSAENAIVKNIKIVNSSIDLTIDSFSSYVKLGLLGGLAAGNFENINIDETNSLNLTFDNLNKVYVGGLIGDVSSTAVFEKIQNGGKINLAIEQTLETELNEAAIELYVGGLVGRFYESSKGTMNNIYATTNINISKIDYYAKETSTKRALNIFAGGLFGDNKRKMSNVVYEGNINVGSVNYLFDEGKEEAINNYSARLVIGGIIGNANGMTNSFFDKVLVNESNINVLKQNDNVRVDLGLLFGRAAQVNYNNAVGLGYSGANTLMYGTDIIDKLGNEVNLSEFLKDSSWLLEVIK